MSFRGNKCSAQGHIAKHTAKIGTIKGTHERQDHRLGDWELDCMCAMGGCVWPHLGRYTGKRVEKPLLVFWGQECLPFGLNGVQVQGTSGLPKKLLKIPPPLSPFSA